MLRTKYDGKGNILSQKGIAEAPRKPVYSKINFVSKLPRATRVQIRAAELAGDPDALDWMFLLNAMAHVDLNNLPEEFVNCFNALTKSTQVTLTQTQVDKFLEK